MSMGFQSCDDEVAYGVDLEVCHQHGSEFSGLYIVEVLAESREKWVFCFSNVVFIAESACYYIDQIAGCEGE